MIVPDHHQYQLLSSTRYDPFLLNLRWNDDKDGPSAFMLLRYHFDRLADAANRHSWNQAKSSLAYSDFKATCQDAVTAHFAKETDQQALKLSLTLSRSGDLAVTTSPIASLLSDPTAASLFSPLADDASLFGILSVYLDPGVCSSSIFTSTKTTYRRHYEDARLRANLPPLSEVPMTTEVLLYNDEGMITESSIFNIAIHRAGQWLTPSSGVTGCLPGVLRRFLLEQGRIHEDKEGQLTKDSIKEGDWVLLFNGVRGCQLGRIVAGVHSI
ncbi:hypothetical protein H0H92_007324 [Tricholoma furcatifolium]|nr:hypothetical protein H0H92_007324 [Tricholoma furcatifolium]